MYDRFHAGFILEPTLGFFQKLSVYSEVLCWLFDYNQLWVCGSAMLKLVPATALQCDLGLARHFSALAEAAALTPHVVTLWYRSRRCL